jgi:hypothetical protein
MQSFLKKNEFVSKNPEESGWGASSKLCIPLIAFPLKKVDPTGAVIPKACRPCFTENPTSSLPQIVRPNIDPMEGIYRKPIPSGAHIIIKHYLVMKAE